MYTEIQANGMLEIQPFVKIQILKGIFEPDLHSETQNASAHR